MCVGCVYSRREETTLNKMGKLLTRRRTEVRYTELFFFFFTNMSSAFRNFGNIATDLYNCIVILICILVCNSAVTVTTQGI